jgi:hypothetical protein
MIAKAFAWFIAYVVPCFILFGGLAGLWISIGYLFDAYSSVTWPCTTGTIIRSELGSESAFKQDEDRTRYWPEVEYQYDVDGETFQSNNITLDGLRSGPHVGTGKEWAEEVLSRYPIDVHVSVHYDRDAPERAVLQTGVSLDNVFVPIFATVLTLIGSVWLWFVLFSRSGGSGHEEQWSGKERVCPKCQTIFTSVQDKGGCPKCHHVFFASEVMNVQEGT